MQSHSEAVPAAAGFAVCIRNDGYPVSLELHRLYWMLQDDGAQRHGLVRIVDESGEDYLYPREFFHPLAPLPVPIVPISDGAELRFAFCIRNDDDEVDLALQRIYAVLPDPAAEGTGTIRVVDETGEDYIYAEEYFKIVDVPPDLRKALLRTD